MERRVSGACKWFSIRKGYGFLRGDDGVEVFIHYSQVPGRDGYKFLEPGQKVNYLLRDGFHGKTQAVDLHFEGPSKEELDAFIAEWHMKQAAQVPGDVEGSNDQGEENEHPELAE